MAEHDLVVVGSGPGGYVAAIRAAQLGLKVAVVERAPDLGGICTNWGCIPTKALLHSAEVVATMRHGQELGILADNLRVDFPRIIARSREVAGRQSKGVAFLLKKNNIEPIQGTGALAQKDGRPALLVDGKPLPAKAIILATGARPKVLPGIEPDRDRVITYFEAMDLPAQPQSLIVIGAGAIGVEFAYFYNAIGTKVTLIEALPQVLPAEDAEIAQQVERALRRQGIDIHTGAKVSGMERSAGSSVRVSFADGKGQARQVEGERLLSAVGVAGNVEGLGLEACGIATERGFIRVDEWYRALAADGKPAPGVYAIGDVIGPPMLAHKASAEGIACVEKIAGVPEREVRRVDYSAIPGATFCRPEVASMGLTEARARERGLDVKIGRFPFKVSGKGQATSETDGLVKVVVEARTGEILGAHIVGGTASDMIATLTLARSAELTATEVLHTVFAHPTFAEVMKGSVEAAVGEAIDL